MPAGPAHPTQRPDRPARGPDGLRPAASLGLTRREHLRLADVLLRAAGDRTPIVPLSTSYPEMTAADAARIRDSGIVRRIASGARIVGAKVSLGTDSRVAQPPLAASRAPRPFSPRGDPQRAPRLGWLTSEMLLGDSAIDLEELIRPRVEAKLAFVLADRLRSRLDRGADLLALTEHVLPCLEIVDVRYQARDVGLVDDIADNCAASRLLTGREIETPTEHELRSLEVQLAGTAPAHDVAPASSPVDSTLWLAHRVIAEGGELERGALLLSAACCPGVELRPGSRVRADFGALGTLELLATAGVST
jgi:2-keto-4-pentenoate hydratase